jgi:hypothetical protein
MQLTIAIAILQHRHHGSRSLTGIGADEGESKFEISNATTTNAQRSFNAHYSTQHSTPSERDSATKSYAKD